MKNTAPKMPTTGSAAYTFYTEAEMLEYINNPAAHKNLTREHAALVAALRAGGFAEVVYMATETGVGHVLAKSNANGTCEYMWQF